MENYEQRVLTPKNNNWLYNAQINVISDKVYLGINANAEDWVEISDEEKQKLEEKIETKATEEDYLEALARLGVVE